MPFTRKFVAMLDEQPVRPLSAVPVVSHPDQDPAPVKPLSLQSELEITLGECLLRGFAPFRHPIAAIPELHGSPAILALRDCAFEIAVVERMVFNFDGQAFVVADRGKGLSSLPRI